MRAVTLYRKCLVFPCAAATLCADVVRVSDDALSVGEVLVSVASRVVDNAADVQVVALGVDAVFRDADVVVLSLVTAPGRLAVLSLVFVQGSMVAVRDNSTVALLVHES